MRQTRRKQSTRRRRRLLRRRRITRRTPLKHRGGAGSTAIPESYPGMTVVAKMPSGEKEDVDSLFTVMSPSTYKGLAGASAEDSVPS
jgi:hypothetical protein